MLMKNFFVISTLLLLAFADLGSSAPRRRAVEISSLDVQSLSKLTNGTSLFSTEDLSEQCRTAVNSALATGILACLPMEAIAKLMGDPTLIPKILKDPFHTVPTLGPIFDAACSVTKCSDDLIQKATGLVLAGCAKDIVAKNQLAMLIYAGLVIYSPAIDIICFKDHAAQYCTIETVNILGLLPPPQITIPGLEKSPLLESVALATPINICSPCNKAIINTFFDYYKTNPAFDQVLALGLNYTTKVNDFVNIAVDVKCGIAIFNDGNVGDPTKGPDPPLPPKSK